MDALGRKVDYLRISITDRCNERCLYCLPEGYSDWKPREEILSYEEILRVARIATSLGFRKFRVTGGEPLVRRDLVPFIEKLSAIEGVEFIGLSTNGVRLAPLARPLRDAGVSAVNISLDALTPSVYRGITRGDIAPVLEGIRAALDAGFERVKLNAVLIRGMNEDEILPLIHFAAEHHVTLRFIELMPVSSTEMLTEKNFLSAGEVMQRLRQHDTLTPLGEVQLGHGPARYYRLEKIGATIGFIGAMTNLHFCDSCNKIRLTADGKIRPCLGNHGEYDLRNALRNGSADGQIAEIFRLALHEKPPEHIFRHNYQPNRIMTAIGG
jgi:cyclic pyranopterin phosphate synthase